MEYPPSPPPLNHSLLPTLAMAIPMTKYRFIILLVLVWIVWFIDIYVQMGGLIALPATIGFLFYGVLRKGPRRYKVLSVVVNPLIVTITLGFALGFYGFVHGEARLMRYQQATDYHEDSLTRQGRVKPRINRWWCGITHPGFVENVVASGNDPAVMLASKLFGPMPGAYTGPYPTLDEARAYLDEHGVEQEFGRFEAGEIVVDERSMVLEALPAVAFGGANCALTKRWFRLVGESLSGVSERVDEDRCGLLFYKKSVIRVAMIDDALMIVQVENLFKNVHFLYLIDVHGEQVIAFAEWASK
ncbi:MAG: hypothetical protein ACNA8W_17810 [Bradymonadaceae bacterium]